MRILVVGAGAIGGPLVLALAADSTVSLRICDDDRVESSNLQRQIQFTSADVGRLKVECLAERVGLGARVDIKTERLTDASASSLFADVDLAIDGSDNFETKFLVNDEARARGVPALIASAIGTRGQLFVSIPNHACYRCLFEAPPASDPGGCAQVGVLAPMPGLVAGVAAGAAAKILAGQPPDHALVVFPGAGEPARTVQLEPRSDCSACSVSSRAAS